MTESTDAVLAEREGPLGRVILNRPRALNALTLPMVRQLQSVLDGWRTEPLRAIVVESASPKAFCAGGDIRAVREHVLDGRESAAEEFFSAEYRLNRTLASYPVPVVALIDGICMGGGLGLSIHGPFRVVSERAQLAMPETAIGFFPDVGASYFLPRLPGAVGMYLGLTGARIGRSDALSVGLATHSCHSANLPALVEALADGAGGSVDAALRRFGEPATSEPGELARHRGDIDWCFGAPSLADVLHRLDDLGSPWAHAQREVLERASPQSLRVTFELISRGRERDLATCLEAELATAGTVVPTWDFREGVRAVLVDKDHQPDWSTSIGEPGTAVVGADIG